MIETLIAFSIFLALVQVIIKNNKKVKTMSTKTYNFSKIIEQRKLIIYIPA